MRRRASPWSIRASCRISSRKAGVALQRAKWRLTVCFTQTRCWPSTTRTTCHPKSRRRSRANRGAVLAEIGQFSLIVALLIAIVQVTLPMIGATRGKRSWMAVGIPAGRAQFIFVAVDTGVLDAGRYAVQRSPAEGDGGARTQRNGLDQCWLPAFLIADVESFY